MTRVRVLYVDLPRCSAKIGKQPLERFPNQRHKGDQCLQPGKYVINNRPFCSKHAGQKALEILIKQNQKKTS